MQRKNIAIMFNSWTVTKMNPSLFYMPQALRHIQEEALEIIDGIHFYGSGFSILYLFLEKEGTNRRKQQRSNLKSGFLRNLCMVKTTHKYVKMNMKHPNNHGTLFGICR